MAGRMAHVLHRIGRRGANSLFLALSDAEGRRRPPPAGPEKKIGYAIDVDGAYGPKSKAVRVKLQKADHLDADGIVGPMTWKAARR